MGKSMLCDLVDGKFLQKWSKAIEASEEAFLYHKEKKALNELEAGLDEKSRILLNIYTLAIEDRINYLHYNLRIKTLNLGVKIGMELLSSPTEYDE